MTPYPFCELFQITSKEIEARRIFLGFTPDDESHLIQIHQVIHDEIDDIVAEFYAHLFRFDELRRFFGDRRTLERLQAAQKQYLLSLGQQADHLAYFEERLRVGVTHERVGLKQKWYLGAYSILFEILGRRLAARYVNSPTELLQLLTTLKKIITLDTILAVETYYQATMQRLENILSQLTEAQHQLQEISRLDGLTQINNRRYLMEALEVEMHRSQRFHRPFSLLLVDLDHFKQINDQHGHAFGDFVLQRVVQTMRSVLRPVDIIGRYGGEEFAIGLVETEATIAQQIAERVRLKVALTPIECDQHVASVTLSIGLATMTPSGDQIEALIERSDRALYQAKASGRNQICISREER